MSNFSDEHDHLLLIVEGHFVVSLIFGCLLDNVALGILGKFTVLQVLEAGFVTIASFLIFGIFFFLGFNNILLDVQAKFIHAEKHVLEMIVERGVVVQDHVLHVVVESGAVVQNHVLHVVVESGAVVQDQVLHVVVESGVVVQDQVLKVVVELGIVVQHKTLEVEIHKVIVEDHVVVTIFRW